MEYADCIKPVISSGTTNTNKMSKYYVSATRKSHTGAILALKVHLVDTVKNTFANLGVEKTHDQVAASILTGDVFHVITYNALNKNWDVGPVIKVLLRTQQDGKDSNNLDNLPSF